MPAASYRTRSWKRFRSACERLKTNSCGTRTIWPNGEVRRAKAKLADLPSGMPETPKQKAIFDKKLAACRKDCDDNFGPILEALGRLAAAHGHTLPFSKRLLDTGAAPDPA
jgi:hypothetical protein